MDENLRPWLMEVNVSPSLHCTSPLDQKVKQELVKDVFNVIGISKSSVTMRAAFIRSKK
jgi:tubulin polyglutamylase TTLL4